MYTRRSRCDIKSPFPPLLQCLRGANREGDEFTRAALVALPERLQPLQRYGAEAFLRVVAWLKKPGKGDQTRATAF